MQKALFWKKLKEGIVQCELCPHFCVIKEGSYGKCRVRKNVAGTLLAMSYARPVSVNIDPIEKKPLFHFLPASKTFSIGMAGCNLSCSFCQNWELSQKSAEELISPEKKPEEIVKEAIEAGCPSISYTYSEPLVSYEFVMEIAKAAKKKGLKNVIVSNGFINPGPLKEILKYIDAANIDLKSISDEFYKNSCQAKLKPVLEALKILKKKKVWLELTNLIIPGLNDSESEIEKLVVWIKKNLGVDVPLHFTAFYPQYQMMNVPETGVESLIKARKVAMKHGLKFVYTGNLPDKEGSSSFCPKCRKSLVRRGWLTKMENDFKEGKCQCGEKIPGVWQ